MPTNNFKFILRRLLRQPLNTSLHLMGLTMGLCVCLLIGLFIHNELSFDNYHEKANRIYRVNQVWEYNGEVERDFGAPAPLADALRSEIPDLEKVAIAYPRDEKIIQVTPGNRFRQSGILMAEPDLLDIFDFEVVAGNGHEALRKPNQALLTESLAEKFFGREDPLGKTFIYENEHTIVVAGIIKDLPPNTHLPAEMLLSYFPHEKWFMSNRDNWGMTFGASTYTVLKKGAKPADVTPLIRALYDKNLNTDPEELEVGYAELQALNDIHLHPEVEGGGQMD